MPESGLPAKTPSERKHGVRQRLAGRAPHGTCSCKSHPALVFGDKGGLLFHHGSPSSVSEGIAMLDLLGWIFAGLIIGAVARLLMPGKQPMGLIATILLGIVGALIGGFI